MQIVGRRIYPYVKVDNPGKIIEHPEYELAKTVLIFL